MTSASVQKLENMEIVETKPYSILVTGVTGFIGSKLLTRLTAAGYTVKAMSRRKLEDKPGIKNHIKLKNLVKNVRSFNV